MLTTEQVEKLYEKLLAGTVSLENIETHQVFGPALTEWRQDLDSPGSTGFQELATTMLWGAYEFAPMIALMKGESAVGHFSTLFTEIVDLAVAINYSREKLVYSKGKIRRLIDAYDEANPQEDNAPSMSSASSLQERLAAAKKLIGGSQRRFAKIRYWLGIADQTNGTGPLTTAPSPEVAAPDLLADLL